MSEDVWASAALRRSPTPADVAGLGRQEASRRAAAICRAAGRTGATVRCHEWLSALVPLITESAVPATPE